MTAGAISVPTVMPLRFPVAGKPKNSIDSNTLIEIRSETPGTKVYYTVDNTRPNPEKKLGENTTLLYREPFMLREGKRYVKAMARTKDARESNVVTKVFTVEYADPLTSSSASETEGVDDGNNFQDQLEHYNQLETTNMTTSILNGGGAVKGTEIWGQQNSTAPMQLNFDLTLHDPNVRTSTATLNHSYDSLQPNNIVRCVYCDAPRPKNTLCRFCPDCGKPVPVDPNNPALHSSNPGAMGMCVTCRSYVPLNQPNCIVCEANIGPRPKPVVSIRQQDSIVCGSCGANNPSHLTHCASCEHRFPAPIHTGQDSAPLPRIDGELVRCPSCTRVNNPDARYCDWCGEKPIPEQSPMTCSLCKSNNKPYSKFCFQCGSKFTAPERIDPRNMDLGDKALSYSFSTLPMWKTVPLPTLPRSPQSTKVVRAPKPRVNEVQTQTVGLFYPGGKKVNQEQALMQEMRTQELKMRDKQPPLSAVSPGKGYWRQQMDHVCGHLRNYTNNNVEFRSVIGEPRLGKILGTTIDEGEEDMTLSVTFALRGHTEFGDGGFQGLQRDIYQKKKVAFGKSFVESEQEKGGKKMKKSKKKLAREEKMNPEDRLLIKELGPRGGGSPGEVVQLLKEGADPNCLDSEKRAALQVAVVHGRLDCLIGLLRGGADVDKRSGSQNSTALHEAVKKGPDGKDVVNILLEFDANYDVKNDRGLSPYDLAVRHDYNSILALFNAPQGKKATKPVRRRKKKKASSEIDSSESDSELF